MVSEIEAALEQAGYQAWEVVWGPALNADRSNLAFAAQNSQTGQLAVSIRGSDFSFWLNWIEDIAAIRLVPYDQFVPGASKTAQMPNAWASLHTVETYYPPPVSCPPDISKIVNRAENAVAGKYVQLGELAAGSAVELTGTIITPFRVQPARDLASFENALFLWEAAQQHACTTYQTLLQTPFTVPAVGKVKRALAALE